MYARATVKDIEGNYRRHWLLRDLLECYFRLRDKWYLGSKESFAWLKINDSKTYSAFDEALKPTANSESILELIKYVAV